MYDNVSLVTNVKSRDNVLLIGFLAQQNQNAYTIIQDIKKSANSVQLSKNDKSIKKLIDTHNFDRIFISDIDESSIESAVRLSRPPHNTNDSSGLVCYVNQDNEKVAAFIGNIERLYPSANVYVAESNVGTVVMTDAKGFPDQ